MTYQIGAVAGDTSSFVSLCAKPSELESRFFTDNSVASSDIFVEPGQMENNDRTLKELATPKSNTHSWSQLKLMN
ncbi:hypothetical protein CR513_03839, partial [Mucuna pruriens]